MTLLETIPKVLANTCMTSEDDEDHINPTADVSTDPADNAMRELWTELPENCG